jgi:thiol-disulfide isomerase/thioredoxin
VISGIDGAGLVALAATLAIATVAGSVLRARAGRVRRTTGASTGGWALAGRAPAAAERVLLLQLSSPVCAPCRRTAELLGELAARTPGLAHHEIDLAGAPDVARELDVLRTPTVVAFDRAGTELLRISGVPRLADLHDALAPALRTR